MSLRKSSLVHLIPVAAGRILVLHALNQTRWVVEPDIAQMIALFQNPQPLFEANLPKALLQTLEEMEILTRLTPEAELARVGEDLKVYHGRDPGLSVSDREVLDALDQKIRRHRQSSEPYWSVTRAARMDDFREDASDLPQKTLLMFGDCDLHMEQDFLKTEARARGFRLQVLASFPDDPALAKDIPHDMILIGALRSRHSLVEDDGKNQAPSAYLIHEAVQMIEGLRQYSKAPILIDNLPEPTLQPLGFAEQGLMSHRNRFRLANLALSETVQTYDNVYIVDVAAAFAAFGADLVLDDAQMSFTHLGSPGWLLQRIAAEKAAVHGIFPDLGPLKARLGGDPYLRERLMAKVHMDAMESVLSLRPRKCVIVDLDGVLWPGVLAETGAPFAWSAEISSPFSYVGLFFGIHEALLCLKRRGIVLVCVSKNDEETVKSLWQYGDHYPKSRLLTLADFASYRINWKDKAENIQDLIQELGFSPESFVFIDDHPLERERIARAFPEILILGDDLLDLRRRVLTEPGLQPAKITRDAKSRSDRTRASLLREKTKLGFEDRDSFLKSLNLEIICERLGHTIDNSEDGPDQNALDFSEIAARLAELFQRTTQFTTTSRGFSLQEIQDLTRDLQSSVFFAKAKDRFGDHGLVGACLIRHGEILAFAVSCRVLGLGVETALLDFALKNQALQIGSLPKEVIKPDDKIIWGQICPTPRNLPVRNLYRDHGFRYDVTTDRWYKKLGTGPRKALTLHQKKSDT